MSKGSPLGKKRLWKKAGGIKVFYGGISLWWAIVYLNEIGYIHVYKNLVCTVRLAIVIFEKQIWTQNLTLFLVLKHEIYMHSVCQKLKVINNMLN